MDSSSSTWTKSLKGLPSFTQDDVDKWANTEANIPKAKQSKAYSNFVEGYIHDIECKYVTTKRKVCYIENMCHCVTHLTETFYKIYQLIIKE